MKEGRARVEITGSRPVRDPRILKMAGGVPPREDYIPPKHHKDSTRIVEITGPDSAMAIDLPK